MEFPFLAPNPVPVIVIEFKTLPLSGEIEPMTGAPCAPSDRKLPARDSSTALASLFAGFAFSVNVGNPSLMGTSLESRRREAFVSVIGNVFKPIAGKHYTQR